MAIRYFKGIVSQKMKLFRVILFLKLRTAVQTVFVIRSSIKRYEQNYISKYISFTPFIKSMCFRPLNPLMHVHGVHTARFLKYVWPFYNIMHERVSKDPMKSP